MERLLAKLALVFGLIATQAVWAGETAPTMGEDGIYHYDWYHQSFLELADDIEEAQEAGKTLMVKFDQKACIYCEKIALEILAEPAINQFVREKFLVVQLDLFGNRDVTDLDGTMLAENEMAKRWGVMFTPTIYFLSGRKQAGSLPMAADAVMPGAFGKLTFLGMLKWVSEGGPDSDEPFQKYLARTMNDLRAEIKAAKQS